MALCSHLVMPRNLLLSLLAVGFLAIGLYLGLSRNSLDEEESRFAAFKSQTALPQGAFERRSERATLNPSVLGTREVQKRGWPVPEEDDVYQLIEEALLSSEAEDRAFALSELGLLEPTADILLACFEALRDSQEDVRVEAALALEMLEEPAAIPHLRVVAERDPSQEVRETAAEALESLMNP